MSKTKNGALRVWHIPQVPMKAFYAQVPDLKSAALILDALSSYDSFQFENRIKPDYCSAHGLGIYSQDDAGSEFGSLIEWHCSDGEDIRYHIRNGSDLDELVWEMGDTE